MGTSDTIKNFRRYEHAINNYKDKKAARPTFFGTHIINITCDIGRYVTLNNLQVPLLSLKMYDVYRIIRINIILLSLTI